VEAGRREQDGVMAAAAHVSAQVTGADRAPSPAARGRQATPFQAMLHRPVCVFDEDPDLLDGVEPAEAASLRRDGVARAAQLAKGPWTPRRMVPEHFAGYLGLLVLDGVMTSSIEIDGLASPELIGPGDLLRPWDDDGAQASLPHETTWSVLEPVTLAILDPRFARTVGRCPQVSAALLRRASRRARWLSFRLAIAQVRRTDGRLLMLMWHLADRYGRITPDGVVLPLPLTHALLAQLVRMRRPSVSTALARLSREGHVRRRPDGTWQLGQQPPDIVALRRTPLAELV
jgi:CRP/FNR family transcriptional regulator, cyclic AMP receptor protein